jgi:AcrR family transcriptional regulator
VRSDARRNHAQLLRAARDVVIERGPGAPLEEVARRAGVGIATLYRRFPDRGRLLTAVAVEALESSRAAAEHTLDEDLPAGRDRLDALASYLHDLLDLRVSAVMPLLFDRDDLDDDLVAPVREASAVALERQIALAHDDGSLSSEVTFGDIGTLMVRLSRPLPGGLSRAADNELAHRHLDLALAGMRAGVLTSPGWSRPDLGALRQQGGKA